MPGMVVCFTGFSSCLLAGHVVELIVETMQTNSHFVFYSKWCCGFVACKQGYQQLVVSVIAKRISEAIQINLIGKLAPLYCFRSFL